MGTNVAIENGVALEASVHRLHELLERLKRLSNQLARAHENFTETRRLARASRQRYRGGRKSFAPAR